MGSYISIHLEVSPGTALLSRDDLAWIRDNINPHVISWYLARSQRIKLYTLNEETFRSKRVTHYGSKITVIYTQKLILCYLFQVFLHTLCNKFIQNIFLTLYLNKNSNFGIEECGTQDFIILLRKEYYMYI